MVLKWGFLGGIISFFAGAVMTIWIVGFKEAFAYGVIEFLKACFQWAIFGFIIGTGLRKWVFRTFWS